MIDRETTLHIPQDDMDICLSVLQRIADQQGAFPRTDRFNSLIAKIYREGKRHDKRMERLRIEQEDREIKAQTAMVHIQRDAVAPAAALLAAPATQETSVRKLNKPETCYICKTSFTEVHFFYHLLCPSCASYNYQMRHLSADLKGRIALVTGGRVKIGHQTVLRLLRDGARVIVTTRFPNAAAKRLHAEPDSAEWLHRLAIYGLDLRNLPAVEAFAAHLMETEPHLDIVIHNAAQTIRRPQGFYQDLILQERKPTEYLPAEARRLVLQDAAPDATALLTDGTGGLVAPKDVMTVDALMDNEERLDNRHTNSWMLRLDEVSAPGSTLRIYRVLPQ